MSNSREKRRQLKQLLGCRSEPMSQWGELSHSEQLSVSNCRVNDCRVNICRCTSQSTSNNCIIASSQSQSRNNNSRNILTYSSQWKFEISDHVSLRTFMAGLGQELSPNSFILLFLGPVKIYVNMGPSNETFLHSKFLVTPYSQKLSNFS